ncbi:MAG: hypothetical protein ACYCPT_09115 [Acidimicrobiales bacterium]
MEEAILRLTEELEHPSAPTLKPIELIKEPIKPLIPIAVETNLLSKDELHQFMKGIIIEENNVCTPIESTTITLKGMLKDIKIHESEMTSKVKLTTYIGVAKSNYGYRVHESWINLIKNRKKKPQSENKKLRKKQGTGTEFNSQISLHIRANLLDTAKIFKFKLFRNGRLQLPGITPFYINDALVCIDILRNAVSQYCRKPVEIEYLVPTMKNYKFHLNAAFTHINLISLSRFLLADKDDKHLIFIKYSRKSNKLSIKYETPISSKNNKTIRIDIWRSGKFNILGGLHDQITKALYCYIVDIIKKNMLILLH